MEDLMNSDLLDIKSLIIYFKRLIWKLTKKMTKLEYVQWRHALT